MPLSFAKKGVASAPKQAETGKPHQGSGKVDQPSTIKVSQASHTASSAPSKQGGGMSSFIKRGAQAKQAVAEAEAKAEMAKAEQNKAYRYRIQEGEEGTMTFLDGELGEDGLLDVPVVHEHTVKLNGSYHNFVCTAEIDGHCPICDGGDSKPYIAGLLTVIDHKPYTSTQGKNAGKTYVNRRKLYVAKKETMKLLTKKAQKHGGLTGVTFEVSRSGDKSAAVGSALDFVEKNSLGQLRLKYDLQEADCVALDYDKELVYRSPDELVELGVGKAKTGIGYNNSKADKQALADQL